LETAAPTPVAVSIVRVVAAVVIVLAVPLFLVTNAVRSVTLDDSLYMSEFAKYGVGRVTGLPEDELRRVARAFVDYFQADPGELRVTVQTFSGPASLFNDREIRHMVDVQALMQLVFRLRIIALVALVAGAITILATGPRDGAATIFKATAIGGVTAVLLIGALSVAAAFDFEQLFLQFHFMSFSNDLWLLDPRTDRLIQLFPQGFFFDLAMRIGIQTVGLGLATLIASLGIVYTLGGRQTSH
jgi:integral membrane protein (TIGR01906 family)